MIENFPHNNAVFLYGKKNLLVFWQTIPS